jgi:hypothetical protein
MTRYVTSLFMDIHAGTKVYCQDCLFFLDARRPHQRRCLHPHSRRVIETPVAHVQQWLTPEERNPDNHCRDFRPWRFWERLLRIDPAFLWACGLLLVVLLSAWWSYQGR